MTPEELGSAPASRYPDLHGRVAVVTGGSKGIGAETCRQLVANGAHVAVVARDELSLGRFVESLRADGGTAVGIAADCSTPEGIDVVRSSVEQELGPAELVFPFAGGFSSFTPVLEIGLDEWEQVLADNLTSAHLTVRAFAPSMVEEGGGAFVLMSSVSGRSLDKLVTASYAAAKAGLLMYMRHAAIELAPRGVRLNAIAPATIHTERIGRIMDSEAIARTERLSPLGRMGTAADCAAAALYLASDVSSWLTGVTIDVAGGRAMM